MTKWWRRLDNTAKIFSLEGRHNSNIFRLSVILKEKVDVKILKSAILKTLDNYPSYRVKLKSGLFWNYLEFNNKEPLIEEECGMPCENINFLENNGYLFKVTYFKNKLNLDIFHVLTDGLGASIFLKGILYNYFNDKYNIKEEGMLYKDNLINYDQHLKQVDKKLVCFDKYPNAYLIKGKSNHSINKTYHYILDLNRFKGICKKHKVSITEYLTSIYIYAIYKTLYDKLSKKDIAITIPIDLRNHYKVQSFSNFFTHMNVMGDVCNKQYVSFRRILRKVHQEFRNKLTIDKIKKYLARDVKLGTNIGIRLVPLSIKKLFINHMEKLVNQSATTTLSNIGQFKISECYREYIDNVMVLVNSGNLQKIKCTVCSYENKLNVTINSNLLSNEFENEFYRLLKKYIGKVKLESNVL